MSANLKHKTSEAQKSCTGMEENMKEFQGKITVITGGGAGIGKTLAEELAGKGSTVIIADINEGPM